MTGNTERIQADIIEYVGDQYAFLAGAAITAGQPLYVSADNTLSPVATIASQPPVGVAISSATETGQTIAVRCHFKEIFTFRAKGGTINAGAYVKPDGTTGAISEKTYAHVVAITEATDPSNYLVIDGGAVDTAIRAVFLPKGNVAETA